ncbi:hypothetical protein [Bacillus xiapuensis]|uniref:hypothetical protein n=1 Tax=Bacillus xiapuensis TaxID=2014075 RepID=UPI0038BB3633
MKNERGMRYFCRRLGYHTKPEYRFDCWNPKEPVIRLMKKGFWQLVIASRH